MGHDTARIRYLTTKALEQLESGQSLFEKVAPLLKVFYKISPFEAEIDTHLGDEQRKRATNATAGAAKQLKAQQAPLRLTSQDRQSNFDPQLIKKRPGLRDFTMFQTSRDQTQWDMFSPLLKSFINLDHPLIQLADRLDWSSLEDGLRGLFAERPPSDLSHFQGCNFCLPFPLMNMIGAIKKLVPLVNSRCLSGKASSILFAFCQSNKIILFCKVTIFQSPNIQWIIFL